jgi:hypothetical protein
MRKRFAYLLACVCLLSIEGASPTRAQAGNATPTPTATLSAPQIVSRMVTADRKKNSVHIALQVQATTPGTLDLSMHLTGDASNHPQLISEVVTVTTRSSSGTQTSLPKSSRLQAVVVGDRVAVRKGKGSWNCQTLQSFLKEFFDVMKTLNPRIQSTELAGTNAIDRISVWHVRAQETATLLGGSLTAPVDLYISRADFTLVREHVTAIMDTGSGSLHETLTADFTRYGESVRVALPADCSVPLEFSIQRLALESPNAKPDWTLKRPSPTRVPRGKEIQVGVYMLYRTVRARTTIYECGRVWRNGKRVFTSCNHDTVRLSDQGGQQAFSDSFTPWHTGKFRFTVNGWSGPKRQRKTIWFWVVPGR